MATLAEKVNKFLEMFGAAGEEVLETAGQNEKAADKAGFASKEETVTTTETLKNDETEVVEESDELTPEEEEFAQALTEAIDERVQLALEGLAETETKEQDATTERFEKLERIAAKLLKQNEALASAIKELAGEAPAGVKKFVASAAESTKTKATTKAAQVTDPYESFQEEFIGNFFMAQPQLNGRQE